MYFELLNSGVKQQRIFLPFVSPQYVHMNGTTESILASVWKLSDVSVHRIHCMI